MSSCLRVCNCIFFSSEFSLFFPISREWFTAGASQWINFLILLFLFSPVFLSFLFSIFQCLLFRLFFASALSPPFLLPFSIYPHLGLFLLITAMRLHQRILWHVIGEFYFNLEHLWNDLWNVQWKTMEPSIYGTMEQLKRSQSSEKNEPFGVKPSGRDSISECDFRFRVQPQLRLIGSRRCPNAIKGRPFV